MHKVPENSQRKKTLSRARSLRRTMTEAERVIWTKLRGRRFAQFKFRRQVPLGPFIVDFLCFERTLVIELDGGQHVRRKHYDEERSRWLQEQGYRVVRIWNHHVWTESEAVEELIWRELQRG